MFKYATGWLGWTPDIALDTPIPLIELALDGKLDFVRRTDPFRSADGKPAPPPPDKGKVAQGLAAFLRGRKQDS